MSRISSFRIHYTWIFVYGLITAIIVTQFPENYSLLQKIILGAVVFGLFLLMTVVRELVLSTAVLRIETPINRITLFAFGAIYHENKDRVMTAHLPLLYLIRFLSHLVIAAIFWGLYATFINSGNSTLAGVVQWLAYIYILLFLVHFMPAFPLDGGEILRMLLWKSTGDFYKATHTACLIGLAAGLLMVFAGVLVGILTRQLYFAMVIVLMGWIIQIAADYTRREMKLHLALQNITVEDIMTAEYPMLSGETTVGQMVHEHVLRKGWRYVIIAEGGEFKGILTLDRVKKLPVKAFQKTRIDEAMTPAAQLMTVAPQQMADVILDDVYHKRIQFVPVLDNGNIVGVVTRDAIMNLVRVRTGFGSG
ncbi:MAG: CBS domain-containing protein [Dehalococcoidales bacterium]|nr:CBS domain-containing protein [Dehalococcoidales bacterium]